MSDEQQPPVIVALSSNELFLTIMAALKGLRMLVVDCEQRDKDALHALKRMTERGVEPDILAAKLKIILDKMLDGRPMAVFNGGPEDGP